MAAWLRGRLGLSGSRAGAQVRLARSLRCMPIAREALADGAVSTTAVALLASAREADAAQCDASESALVDLARALPVRDLGRAIERWRQLADARSEREAAERRFERRGLFASPTLDGMVRIDGNLDPETGETVLAALRSVLDDRSRFDSDDGRRPAQRRADALAEICRRYLDSSDRPTVAGERPYVTVTVDLESLEGRAGRRCQLDRTGRISPETVRRLACDAAVTRVVLSGASEPLDVGRRTPVVPAPLRRAVTARDGRYRFPGATDHRHGATRIMSCTGPTVERRPSPA
jgi:hypothetical protein